MLARNIFILTAPAFALIIFMMRRKWQNSAKQKLIAIKRKKMEQQRNKLREKLQVQDEHGQLVIMTENRKNIIKMTSEDLMRNLKEETMTPIEVLEAYQAKAIEVTEQKNCICDFITEASEWALELEKVPKEKRGPLFGIPVSIKECFYVKGYDSSIGLLKFLNKPAEEDGSFVAALKHFGAVPFCKTNIPQTMKSICCSNPIYGSTRNPFADDRSPGGSSGGESCLIGAGGSLLGIGTDIGGSVRIPSLFCGIYALKPTGKRLPETGRMSSMKGLQAGISSVSGFMSRDLDILINAHKQFFSNVGTIQKVYPSVFPIPWNESSFSMQRKLRIGWFDETPSAEPTPGCKRAVQETVAKLIADGHEVVKVNSTWIDQASHLFLDLALSDGGINNLSIMKDEIIDHNFGEQMIMIQTPTWFKRTVLSRIVRLSSKTRGFLLEKGLEHGSEIWDTLGAAERLKHDVHMIFEENRLDAIVSPSFSPAPKLKDMKNLLPWFWLTIFANVLDLPVGVLPVTEETAQDQENLLNNYPSKKHSRDAFYINLQRSSIGAEGMPLGVQVVGRHFDEERVLGVMKVIDDILKRPAERKTLKNGLSSI